ncbi:hypothetical protein D3C81_1261230 [compost metagenome]
MVSEVPSAMANAEKTPQTNTPITLENSNTSIAPEHGRIPIANTMAVCVRQSLPACSSLSLGIWR